MWPHRHLGIVLTIICDSSPFYPLGQHKGCLHMHDTRLLPSGNPASGPLSSSCSVQVEKQRASWAQLHSELVAATPETSITLDDLTWALQCVRSRAFSGPYGGADAQGLA